MQLKRLKNRLELDLEERPAGAPAPPVSTVPAQPSGD